METPRIVIGCNIDACTSEVTITDQNKNWDGSFRFQMLAEMALSGVLGLVDNIHIVGTALQYRYIGT